jgi:hypothetical protein
MPVALSLRVWLLLPGETDHRESEPVWQDGDRLICRDPDTAVEVLKSFGADDEDIARAFRFAGVPYKGEGGGLPAPNAAEIASQCVIYGSWPDADFFVVISEEEADEAEQVEAIRRVKTLGELRALAPTLTVTIPMDPAMGEDGDADTLDDLEHLADSTIYYYGDAPLVQGGDWPRLPGQSALDWLPDDVLALGRIGRTAINGELFEFPCGAEAELLAALGRNGFAARRDDALIAALLGWA